MSLTRARWRLALTLLCLFASTFQTSLAQTHVHGGLGDEPYVAAGAGHTPDSPNHSGVTRDNTACPLCQIFMLGGGLPSAPYQVVARSFTAAVHASLEQVPACFISAVSYDWQSRGPPRI